MSIKEIQKKYSSIEIELLLSHTLGKPKEFLFMNPDARLSAYKLTSLLALIKRRQKGEPIAYILGYKDFCGLRFGVNSGVLIPRPETEWIVERVTKCVIPNGMRNPLSGDALSLRDPSARRRMHSSSVGMMRLRVLDVGTGSGCIAVSLVNELRGMRHEVRVTASDISAKALAVAKGNAKKHKAKIKFIQSDLFAKINGQFNVIVANLPYVPLNMLHRFMLHKKELGPDDPFLGLKFEPKFALTDGTSSWQIYRKFFRQAAGHLAPNAVILLEIDPASKKFITLYQKKYLPAGKLKFYRDFNNLLRYAEIKFG